MGSRVSFVLAVIFLQFISIHWTTSGSSVLNNDPPERNHVQSEEEQSGKNQPDHHGDAWPRAVVQWTSTTASDEDHLPTEGSVPYTAHAPALPAHLRHKGHRRHRNGPPTRSNGVDHEASNDDAHRVSRGSSLLHSGPSPAHARQLDELRPLLKGPTDWETFGHASAGSENEAANETRLLNQEIPPADQHGGRHREDPRPPPPPPPSAPATPSSPHPEFDDRGVAEAAAVSAPSDSAVDAEKWCRCRGEYVRESLFRHEACAWCYAFVFNSPKIFGPGKKWGVKSVAAGAPPASAVGLVGDDDNGSYNNVTITVLSNGTHAVRADHEAENSFLHQTFVSEEQTKKWTDCCEKAIECCSRIGIPFNETKIRRHGCPATWDGWQCWPDTQAGHEVEEPCPGYIYFETQPPRSSTCQPPARKRCESDGQWFKLRSSEWSNYSTCSNLDFYVKRERVHIGTYAVSIVALIPALVIFNCYKQLRMSRIILHQHLFVSLLLNAISVIIFKRTMIVNEFTLGGNPEESEVFKNGVLCRILFACTRYFRVTNYMWMFCEGFYLHKLVAVAFAQQPSLRIFYFVGWVFPIVPVAIYSGLRLGIRGDEDCWIRPEEAFEWTTNLPCLVALLLNVVFLANIIRILITKLRASNNLETAQYRKAVRATLVLVPLFGVHFLITLYRPHPEVCSEILRVYDHVRNAIDGLQGFFVALLFCYLNGEVLHLLKRSYHRFVDHYWPHSRYLSSRTNRGSVFNGRSVMSTHVASTVESPRVSAKQATNDAAAAAVGNHQVGRQTADEPVRQNGTSPPDVATADGRRSVEREVPTGQAAAEDRFPLLDDARPLPTDLNDDGRELMRRVSLKFIDEDEDDDDGGGGGRGASEVGDRPSSQTGVARPSLARPPRNRRSVGDLGYSSHENIPMLSLARSNPGIDTYPVSDVGAAGKSTTENGGVVVGTDDGRGNRSSAADLSGHLSVFAEQDELYGH